MTLISMLLFFFYCTDIELLSYFSSLSDFDAFAWQLVSKTSFQVMSFEL
jgi:hypothetical protein